MKILIAVLFFPFCVFAANTTPLDLKKAVAFDLQLLMDDTVNEGQNIASVIFHGDTPNVRCNVSRMQGRETRQWAFCFVDFHVVAETGPETNRTCAVLYSFEPSDIFAKIRRGGEKTFLNCMEILDAVVP